MPSVLLSDSPASAEIIAGQRCPVCGSEGEPAGIRDGAELRRCVECDVLLSFPWSSVEAYEALYRTSGLYHIDEQIEQGQKTSEARDTEHLRAAHSRLTTLRSLYPESRTILDVGCGTGAFVASAEAFGYSALGIDPSPDAAKLGQRLGRRIHQGSWTDLPVAEFSYYPEARGYDVITLHDVWEHLTQPVACLKHLKRCLAPCGMLVVEIPEWGCPQARAEGVQWKHVRPTQHLFLPSDAAARTLFARAGLTVEAAIRPLRGRLGKICYYLSATGRGED